MSRASGMHVEDKHIQGFDIKKNKRDGCNSTGADGTILKTGLKETGWE
jgi:hypothetical protein